MTYILVADDDELLAELVRRRLCAAGHEVVTVDNGQECLAMVQQRRPDLILLDAMMPVMDGISTLHTLKDDTSWCTIPVIMMTARRSQEDVLTALRAGAADYMTKPFSPEDLALRVEGLLASKRFTADTLPQRQSIH